MVFRATMRSPTSSFVKPSMLWLRSPVATVLARPTARARLRLMLSAIQVAETTAMRNESATMTIMIVLACALAAAEVPTRSVSILTTWSV